MGRVGPGLTFLLKTETELAFHKGEQLTEEQYEHLQGRGGEKGSELTGPSSEEGPKDTRLNNCCLEASEDPFPCCCITG